MSSANGPPIAVYQDAGAWKCFTPPFDRAHDHKADVLHDVVEHPSDWFPQLANFSGMLEVRPEQIMLIDDERVNFQSTKTQAKVLRYCKVARYDDTYRDCGFLNQLGGIGAHSDEDF